MDNQCETCVYSQLDARGTELGGCPVSPETNIDYAFLLACRFAKAAVAIVEAARGVLPIGPVDRPSDLLPVVVTNGPRVYCYYGSVGRMDMDLLNPFVMNAAFSLELYLKVLLYLETGKWTMGHDLAALFRKLTPASQRAIRSDFDTAISGSAAHRHIRDHIRSQPDLENFDWDLDVLLANASNAFTEWRYAFERNLGWFAGFWELKQALNARIEHVRKNADRGGQSA